MQDHLGISEKLNVNSSAQQRRQLINRLLKVKRQKVKSWDNFGLGHY